MESGLATTHNKISTMAGLDLRSKLTVFTVITVLLFVFNDPLIQAILLGLSLFFAIWSGLTLSRLMSSLKPLLPVLILIVISTSFFGLHGSASKENQIVLLSIGPHVKLFKTGLLLGITFGFRLIIMVILTKTLLACTSLQEFIQLLTRMKLPGSLSFVTTTAIRFFPELEKKKQLIHNAQRARGADIKAIGLFRSYYLQMSLMILLIINSIIMAEKLTLALLTRGFGYSRERTELHLSELALKDYGVILTSLVILVVAIITRWLTGFGKL